MDWWPSSNLGVSMDRLKENLLEAMDLAPKIWQFPVHVGNIQFS